MKRLSARISLPLLSKDVFKELLFDCLHTGDRAWSRQLSNVAYRLMFQQAEELQRTDIDCILEGNFREAEHREAFARLGNRGAMLVQVHCRAAPDVLVARFKERAHAGARHAGHADLESLPEIEIELRTARQAPLPIDCELVECDTSDDWSTAIDRAVARTLTILKQ
jgi:predicted kinase